MHDAEPGVEIAERYSGAGRLVLGGYLAGLMVGRLRGAAAVTLRSPVTVGDRVAFVRGDPARLVGADGTVVAEATPLHDLDVDPPAVSVEDAERAAAAYPGLHGHLFPRCFCCGPARPDGLRIFPGRVDDRGIVAAPWTPGADLVPRPGREVPIEVVCAALDCPAIWALVCAGDAGSEETALTGRLEVRVTGPIEAGRRYVVVGWPIGSDGRKRFAGAAVRALDGHPLAVARQTMVVTGSGVPLGLDRWSGAGQA